MPSWILVGVNAKIDVERGDLGKIQDFLYNECDFLGFYEGEGFHLTPGHDGSRPLIRIKRPVEDDSRLFTIYDFAIEYPRHDSRFLNCDVMGFWSDFAIKDNPPLNRDVKTAYRHMSKVFEHLGGVLGIPAVIYDTCSGGVGKTVPIGVYNFKLPKNMKLRKPALRDLE